MSQAVARVNAERAPANNDNRFVEYKGVAHVHSFLGGHSSGTFSDIIDAAKANGLQFVIMTEHTERDFDTSAMTLRGVHGGVLFVNGNEVSTANDERLLIVPGDGTLAQSAATQDVLNAAAARRAVAIAAYPEEFKSWGANGVSGVEVFNVYTNARRINPVVAFFDVLWSRRTYPDLIFALYYTRPDENLKKWDQELMQSRSTALAGNDAHSNIGIHLKDSSGNTLLGIQLDPYETSFRLVRMHVLLERNRPLDEANLLDAIKAGHCFIGMDFLGDSSGFSFTSETKIQGDEIAMSPATRLTVKLPVSARVLLFKDGSQIADENGITSKDFAVTERGVYRVEVYLAGVSSGPWIISNPIYVR